MGLEKKPKGNFLKIKEGKFFSSKEPDTPYDQLSGKIVDLGFKNDEFNGQTIRKLVITVEDDGERNILSLPVTSSYASSVVSFLKNADLSQEVTLIPKSQKVPGKENPTNTLFVVQNDKYMKSYFTQENNHGQPSFKKVMKKSGKVEWDKEDFLEFRENVVMNELKPTLTGSVPAKKVSEPSIEDEDDDSEELPF